ncbi:MAG: methyltransferase domain-containing protein, partial [Wenzhouxiangella sp.]
MTLDTIAVARAFSRAATNYDRHAVLQREVGERLLGRLDGLIFKPGLILDLGCGTGVQAQALNQRFGDARVVAMDLALPMLDAASSRRGWWKKRFDCVAGNATALPLAEASFDLVYSNLMLQWCDDLAGTLASLRRVLKPGGLLLVSTFGRDTLTELRQAWAKV